MRKYELYLDESGRFIDEKKAKSPSLIGGILVKPEDISIEKANSIMKNIIGEVSQKYVHINDLSKENKTKVGEMQVEALQKIRNIPSHMVIFENTELLEFNDDKLLYLNIMAEGIVNLLEKLSSEKADPVELNVIVAVRRDLKYDDGTVFETEEYCSRIKERIYIKMAKKDLFLSKNCRVNFNLSSARKNAKLMLADIVCNTRLTRNSRKFSEHQKVIIEKFFATSKYVFNVFKGDLQKKISDCLIQNNIVDALFLLNEMDDQKEKNNLANLIINNINTMSVSNLRIQLELLSLKIRGIIEIQRNLGICENFLLTIQRNIINKIKVKDFMINKLKLDISLYLLTIYTHQGQTLKAEEQIQISEEGLKNISDSWNFLEYYSILKIREAVYYNDCFDNEKAIYVLTDAMKKYESILEPIGEIEEFKNIKSDYMAKFAGTRLQTYISLINTTSDEIVKNEYYEIAKKDSEYAIEQFVSVADKRRQYQYRASLELVIGNTNEAVKYLMKTEGINEIDFKKFLNEIANTQEFSKHFIMTNYFEIMQYNNDTNLGKIMYEEFKQNEAVFEEYAIHKPEKESLYSGSEKTIAIHPFELIYYHIGKYLMASNEFLAMNYFKKALEICDEMPETTIKIFELAIEANKLLLSKNINNDKNNIIQKYKQLTEKEDTSEVQKILQKLKDDFEIIELFDDETEIRKACKNVEIKIRI